VAAHYGLSYWAHLPHSEPFTSDNAGFTRREAFMSFHDEFAVVDIIVQSTAETRGVDALILSIVKMERQARRLFTHLVFQCDAFGEHSTTDLIATLERCRDAYVTGFISGIDALACFTVADLVGGKYGELRAHMSAIYRVRNKVLHGQLTGLCLGREDLLAMVATVTEWCKLLATGALDQVGYDGFGRDSLQKSNKALAENYRRQLASIEDYRQFIEQHVAGRTRW
jgi:hypothetical protein